MASDPTVPLPSAAGTAAGAAADPGAPSGPGTPAADADLMRRAAEGDADAFSALVHRYRRPVFSFAARLLGDASAAEDVAQEAFARAYQARGRWKPSAKVSTWLFQIAKNAALDRKRHAKHVERNASPAAGANTTGLLGRVPDSALTPCSSAQSVELEVAVEQALASLPETYRLPVVLCSFQGMSYEEAAEVVGVNGKTLSTRLARGREMLRQALAPHLGEGAR